MKLIFLVLSGLVAYCAARPNNFDNLNLVTVPPNCPVGQVWVNGQCRDIWRLYDPLRDNFHGPATGVEEQSKQSKDEASQYMESITPKNMVTVPPNCPVGQQWINGACRDIWRQSEGALPNNVVTVPPNCPVGQEYVNGQCRDIWRVSLLLERLTSELNNTQKQNREIVVDDTINYDGMGSLDIDRGIITVPNQCPTGQRPDALGFCRPILD